MYFLNNKEFAKRKITQAPIKRELSFRKIDIWGVNFYTQGVKTQKLETSYETS